MRKWKRQIGTFAEVLTAAIKDITDHGFDSMERIERWVTELRASAERSLVSEARMEQMLRGALGDIYKRMVDRGGIAKYHHGADRFTIDRVKPKLRAELDRRILASSDLIKLNRQAAIDKTLQRFQGWSTSIPASGTEAVNKRKVRNEARKAMASLPFIERRVLIDQGHKLIAAISEIVATDGGAVAGRWRSHWRQLNYNYREDHKERDDKLYLVRDSWAHNAGLVKKGKNGYTDEITAPGFEINCRCYWIWIYSVRDIDADMVTAKGRAKLKEASAARTDEQETDAVSQRTYADEQESDTAEAIDYASKKDVLHYLRGLKRSRSSGADSKWHAQYDPDRDEIVIFDKFFNESRAEQLHILVHEAGHRGQDVDKKTYEAFKKAHLHKISDFRHIANRVHLKEFSRTGKVDGLAAEIFAESYARAMCGLAMPKELAQFWRSVLKDHVDGELR